MPEIARLSTAQADFGERLATLTAFDSALDDGVERTVAHADAQPGRTTLRQPPWVRLQRL